MGVIVGARFGVERLRIEQEIICHRFCPLRERIPLAGQWQPIELAIFSEQRQHSNRENPWDKQEMSPPNYPPTLLSRNRDFANRAAATLLKEW